MQAFLLDRSKPVYFTCFGYVHCKVVLMVATLLLLMVEMVETAAFIFGGFQISSWQQAAFEVVEYIVLITLIVGILTESAPFLLPFIAHTLVCEVLFLMNSIYLVFLMLFPYSATATQVFGDNPDITWFAREKFLALCLAVVSILSLVFGFLLQVAFTCFNYFEDREAERKTRLNRPAVPPLVDGPTSVVTSQPASKAAPSFGNPNFSISDDEEEIFERKN